MNKLEQLFASHKIDTTKPGFFDDPAFVAAEKVDPLFLDNYARFIANSVFSPEYIARARIEITLIASICHQELVTDGRLGACIDIGMILSRILEREGFWNYQVKGGLTIQFPPASGIGPRYFWYFDTLSRGQPAFDAAHSWIVAPPFNVVDVAIKQQPYDRGRDLIPNMVISDSISKEKVMISDLVSPPLIAFALAKGVPERKILQKFVPHWPLFARDFPATTLAVDQIKLTYIPVAIGAPDLPFEKMNGSHFNGRIGIELYNDLVIPTLRDLRRNKE